MKNFAFAVIALSGTQVVSAALLDPCPGKNGELDAVAIAACVDKWPPFDNKWSGKSAALRQRAALREALDILDAAEKGKGLLNGDGNLHEDKYAAAVEFYKKVQLGYEPQKESGGLSIGRELVDNASFAEQPFKETVPLLVSFRRDNVADKSHFTLLGDVKYALANRLAFEHALTASFDSTTGKPASESSIDLGYEGSHVWTHSNAADETQTNARTDVQDDKFVDDLETSFGIEWNTDRRFDRSAYTAFVKLTPSVDAIGAGYFNEIGAFTVTWQPSLALNAGNVADAGGNEDLLAIKQKGGFVRLVPAASLVLRPTAMPDLGIGFSYTHHYDLTRGWDRGLFTANVSYKLSDPAFVTAIFRKGRKKTTFEEIHDLLLGIGIKY